MRNCLVVIRLSQDQVKAGFRQTCPPRPSLCPPWFLCVPAGVGGPRPGPAVQGRGMCCRPHTPGQHLRPGVAHVQNLAPSAPGRAISFLQAQLPNPRECTSKGEGSKLRTQLNLGLLLCRFTHCHPWAVSHLPRKPASETCPGFPLPVSGLGQLQVGNASAAFSACPRAGSTQNPLIPIFHFAEKNERNSEADLLMLQILTSCISFNKFVFS